MDKITIEIPTELLDAAKLAPEDVLGELAIHLYKKNRLNLPEAKMLAGNAAPKLDEMVWQAQDTGHFDMDNFISWAAHDLKTPLNAIIGFTKVVLKGIDGPINETQATDLTAAHTNGQRMLTLLNNLVDIARINIGQTSLTLEEVDIAKLLTEGSNRWKTQNPSKELEVDLRITAPTMHVDSPRTRQILSSLLTYAAVRVEQGKVSLSANDSTAGINVTIQSAGTKARDKAEMDTAMLGFISEALLRMHGGRLDMLQETDDGMLIYFSLPRN